MNIEKNVKLWKLTTQDNKTRAGEYNETLWGEGVEHAAPGGDLCTNQVLHAYISPELAAFLNPIHANLKDPALWECEGDVCSRDKSDLKVGCTRLRTMRRVALPAPTNSQRVRFAILCAKVVLPAVQCPQWYEWADRYLAGDTQDETAARRAAAAGWAARAASAEAARQAAGAATSGKYVALAAEAVVWAAEAARVTSASAAEAAVVWAARVMNRRLDLAAIAHQAMENP